MTQVQRAHRAYSRAVRAIQADRWIQPWLLSGAELGLMAIEDMCESGGYLDRLEVSDEAMDAIMSYLYRVANQQIN